MGFLDWAKNGIKKGLQWVTDTRDKFMRGFRSFQKSKNPIEQAANAGIEALMNLTPVGRTASAVLEGANAGLDIANKMAGIESETGMSPAQQAKEIGAASMAQHEEKPAS